MPSIHSTRVDDKGFKAGGMNLPTDHDKNPAEFEEAISLTGHGKFHHFLLLGCGLCLVSMIFETTSTSYVLPAAQCDFDMNSSEKGLLSAVIYIGMICSSHFWGFLADTEGRRKILVFTLFMNSLCTLTAGFMPTYWLFLVLRFLNGIFICGPSSVVFAYLGEFHSDKTRTRSTVWVCVFIALGVGVQPGIAWLVIPQKWNLILAWYTFKSWRVFAIICGLPSVITAIMLLLAMPESPKFLLATGREAEALDVLRHMYATNNNKDPVLYPVKALKFETKSIHKAESKSVWAIARLMWQQTKPVFLPPYLQSTVVACFIQFGLYASSNGFLLWIPDLFNRVGQYLTLYPNEPATVCDAIMTMSQPNNSVALHLQYLVENITSTEVLVNVSNNNSLSFVESCNSDVDPMAFQNTLIFGLSSSVAYIVVGYLIAFIPKKILLLILLVTSGSCGMGMYFAQKYLEILILSGFFLVLAGMCVSVVNSVVIDVFPTHLRAMALCISLMMGRVGTVSSAVMLGVLLDLNCGLAIFLLGATVIGCGLMSLLLPSVKTSSL